MGIGIILAGLVAMSGPSQNADIQALEDTLAHYQDQVVVMQAKTAPSKALPANCLTFPLPSKPVGPSWTIRFDWFGKLSDIIIWRMPCSGESSVVLATVKPISADAYYSGANTNIIQGDTQLSSVYFVKGEKTSDFISGDILIPMTGWINVLDSQQLDHNKAFTLVNKYFTGNGRLSVPAYDPSDYNVEPLPASITKDYSGSWFTNSASIQNQGWALVFSEELNFGAAYWFTGSKDGKNLEWFTAVGEYDGDTATLDVFKTTGVTFAGSTGESVEFGTLKIEFENCSNGLATYDLADGRKGTLPMTRLLPAPEGCR